MLIFCMRLSGRGSGRGRSEYCDTILDLSQKAELSHARAKATGHRVPACEASHVKQEQCQLVTASHSSKIFNATRGILS